MSSGKENPDFSVLKPGKAEFQGFGVSSAFATYIFKNTIIASTILIRL